MTSPELLLIRKQFRPDGIFGELSGAGDVVAQTLEHAYAQPGQAGIVYRPKVPAGHYLCVRGPHRLAGMSACFDTFEVQAVPGHSDILFHTGNSNQDSAGCVLLGQTLACSQARQVITASRATFAAWMRALTGVDSFGLTVLDSARP